MTPSLPSLLQDDRKACAGLIDVVAEADRRDERLERSVFGILLAPVWRRDRVLEFLLSGLAISAIGEVRPSRECSIVLPSGIVCGDTVSLLSILSALSVIALSIVGEVGEWRSSSLICVLDADVGKVGGRALDRAALSSGILGCSFDRLSCASC